MTSVDPKHSRRPERILDEADVWRWAAGGTAMLMIATVACGRPMADRAAPAAGGAGAASAGQAGTVPHGDHNPHHGGVVLMKGDLHYEVVLDRSGRSQLFFTDAVREDLPASTASNVTLTIKRPREPDETIVLAIDDAGESWVGQGREVHDPEKATATIAFIIAREPYSIEIPFTAPPAAGKSP